MNIKKLLLAVILVLTSLSSMADTLTDNFSSCLTDNTTGKDRKDLARWMFMAMAAHPNIHDLSSIPPDTSDDINRTMAALVMKLLTDTCAKQARQAAQSGGGESFRLAFETLGRVAMQEIMSNPDVRTTISGFQRYVDRKKLEEALKPQ
jgi:hypothetical protein